MSTGVSTAVPSPRSRPVVLGLRANWRQFWLLVLINAFVGAMVGLERTVLPLIAEADFGIVSKAAMLSFLISFGLVKAATNLVAGQWSDRVGRKGILVVGWLIGLPVPFLIMLAPAWGWIVFANVLLGVNQGLCWSATVIMKMDLAGPQQRGLATGLNEFAGYLAVAISAFVTGYLAANFGLRPVPFYPGVAFAVLGLLLSLLAVRETRGHAKSEAEGISQSANQRGTLPSNAQIFRIASWQDRALFAASQAGLVNNLNDAMVWGLVPLLLAGSGLPIADIGLVAATYPAVWGVTQLATGALSDRWGRKWLIATGMWVQGLGIGFFVAGEGMVAWMIGAVLLGLGTAAVYPTLLAVVSDVAHPECRGSAIGVYRLWRDLGYAVGGVTAGVVADILGLSAAIAAIGGLTMLSGFVVATTMYETLPSWSNLNSVSEGRRL
ncbi:MAG: MFS transporter [Gemmatimonadetes bacterium]|nr:MFS transporter [Gemmatimonadota bacterium]